MRERFLEALLLAALAHGKKAPLPEQRRTYALYYVGCVIRDLKHKRQYTFAFWAADLLTEMKSVEKLYSLKAKYCPNRPIRQDGSGTPGSYRQNGDQGAPAGNTGATPVGFEDLERYI